MLAILGTDGDDVLTGTSGPDFICGLGGNDTIDGGPGDDTIDAGPGDDEVTGGDGDDKIAGADGDDRLAGEARRTTAWPGVPATTASTEVPATTSSTAAAGEDRAGRRRRLRRRRGPALGPRATGQRAERVVRSPHRWLQERLIATSGFIGDATGRIKQGIAKLLGAAVDEGEAATPKPLLDAPPLDDPLALEDGYARLQGESAPAP